MVIVIDGRNHLLGRLSSVIAKQLLLGKKIIVVRCESLCMSGNFKRMKYKYKMYLRKRMNTNPRRGQFHFRSPAKMLIKSVRGMLPFRTNRGKQALSRLEAVVGVPPRYQTKKRMIVPSAHRILCLAPSSRFNELQKLASEYGWKYRDVTNRLEEKRKERGLVYYQNKLKSAALVRKAKASLGSRLTDIESKLAELGYVC